MPSTACSRAPTRRPRPLRRVAGVPAPASDPIAIAIAVALLLLNVTWIHNSYIGTLLAFASALAAPATPCAWIVYAVMSQICADPAFPGVTLAQLGVVAWAVTIPLNGSLSHIRRLGRFIWLVLPLTALIAVLKIGFHNIWPIDWFYGPITFLISALYLADPHTDKRRALRALVLATGAAAGGFWLPRLGLSVVALNYPAESYVLGFDRIGFGRGDSNNVALNLVLFLLGTAAFALFQQPSDRRRNGMVAALAWVIGLPALMATVSRGGIYSVPIGVVLIGALWLRCNGLRGLYRLSRSAWTPAIVLLVAAGGLAVGRAIFSDARTTLGYVQEKNVADANENSEGPRILSGRTDAWYNHLRITAAYPLTGIPEGTPWTFPGIVGPTEVSNAEGGWQAAHNVFLEYGSRSGLGGFFLYLLLFISPQLALVKRCGLRSAAPFLIVMLAIALEYMSLSVASWKTFWVALAIVQAEALYGIPLSVRRRNRGAARV